MQPLQGRFRYILLYVRVYTANLIKQNIKIYQFFFMNIKHYKSHSICIGVVYVIIIIINKGVEDRTLI